MQIAFSTKQLAAWLTLTVGLAACRAAVIPPPVRQRGGVGAACQSDSACRSGLRCTNNACEPSGSLSEAQACDLTAACGPNLYCAPTGLCSPSGSQAEGETCQTSADCSKGLVCALNGVLPLCQSPGSADLGGSCTSGTDCLAGLGCNANGKCEGGVAQFTVTPFTASCGADDASVFKAYFKVPDVGQSLPDFFQLPFPNEARNHVSGGKVLTDLSGFPRPSTGPGKALIESYLDVLGTEQDGGFGLNQPITMRFSQPFDLNTLRYGNATNPTMFFFKLSKTTAVSVNSNTGCDDDTAGVWTAESVPGSAHWTQATNAYQCPNTLAFKTFSENPLEPNSYYALVLLGESDPNLSVKSRSGAVLQRDAELAAVLSNDAPIGSAQLVRAHACYHPLRSALAARPNGFAGKVMAATLFRTQRTVDAVTALRHTFDASPAVFTPAITTMLKCAPGLASPCAAAGDATRDCPSSASADFDEYHGKLSVPVVQTGDRPYQSGGGGVEYEVGNTRSRAPSGESGERIRVQGTEEVCFSLAVPKTGAALPVVLYGHGTGGNFRSAISEGLAQRLTTQAVQKMAVMTVEQPLHGPRRGTTALQPDLLYFNPNNPRASRDNAIQAWADYAAAKLVIDRLSDVTFSLPSLSIAEADGLRAQFAASTRVAFVGHSQGGVNALPFVSTAQIKGAVLSGTGGGLLRTLLGKTAPYNLPVVIGAALGDAELNVFHPVLGLAQTVADRSDGINYGRYFHPPAQSAPRHLMHVIGVADSFTPLATSSDLWSTLRSVKNGIPDSLPQPAFQAEAATEAGPPFPQFTNGAEQRTTALPLLSANLECNCAADGSCGTTNGVLATSYTAASVLYKGDGTYDGHFVMFQHPKAQAQVPRFLANVLVAGSACDQAQKPTIVTSP